MALVNVEIMFFRVCLLTASMAAVQWVSANDTVESLVSAPPERALLPLAWTGAQHLIPGVVPVSVTSTGLPRVVAPSKPRASYTRFPWRNDIVTTVFWIGETPTRKNPTPNTMSAWDMKWTSNYGGFDDPKEGGREGFIPKKFTPAQNPFYFALPYNDISRTGTKDSARTAIPWFEEAFRRNGHTVLKGRWIAIRRNGKVCYAQWEDVGPFETDDWEYVFGEARPKTTKNRGAGLDVSPAVRDYLEFGGGYGTVDWRFVELHEVPDGPWKTWGTNNPFSDTNLTGIDPDAASFELVKVKELRDRVLLTQSDAGVEEGIE